ncbi:MAG TPA: hypothetical protein VMW53_03750 [archaeon]|nr:hypothetical protein [archaeon]
MDGLYEISALLGFVEKNKPQINADERRSIDVLQKCIVAVFGVSTMKGGLVQYNKPQINARERRLIDILQKSILAVFGVGTMEGRGFGAIY